MCYYFLPLYIPGNLLLSSALTICFSIAVPGSLFFGLVLGTAKAVFASNLLSDSENLLIGFFLAFSYIIVGLDGVNLKLGAIVVSTLGETDKFYLSAYFVLLT